MRGFPPCSSAICASRPTVTARRGPYNVTRCLLPVSTSDTSLAWGGDRNGKLSCLQISHPKSASWLNRAIWLVLSRPNACCLLRVGAQTDVILRSRCGILPDLAVDVRQIDPLSIQRPTRSSPTSKTFGRTIGCGHAIAVRSTRSWREMDSNCRFRITNCWRRGSEKARTGALRMPGSLERARRAPRRRGLQG
jgi:hypothetical protein